MGSGLQEHRPTAAVLLAPLRWLALGLVLSSNMVGIEIGRWSLQPVGLLVLAWASVDTRRASTSRPARATWAAAAGACVLAAVAHVAVWGTAPAALIRTLSWLIAIDLIAWALATTTRDLGLSAASRRALVSRALVPASVIAVATALFAVNVGEQHAWGDDGAFMTVGGMRLSLHGWAWPVTIAGLAPLLAVLVWGVAVFVATYREARDAARHGATAIP